MLLGAANFTTASVGETVYVCCWCVCHKGCTSLSGSLSGKYSTEMGATTQLSGYLQADETAQARTPQTQTFQSFLKTRSLQASSLAHRVS